MKRFVAISLVLLLLFLSACGNMDDPPVAADLGEDNVLVVNSAEDNVPTHRSNLLPAERNVHTSPSRGMATYEYRTFEEAILERATDVVIAQYVGQRPFGEHLTEFEFVVSDRILGNAADRIFVYAENGIDAHVIGPPRSVSYHPGEIIFHHNTNYLLALNKIASPYANTHEDGFVLIRNIVIDLDEPANSIMYSESLSYHTDILNVRNRASAAEEIVAAVSELTEGNELAQEVIRSNVMEEILYGSPYVLVVEINEPLSLSSEQLTTDWMRTDIYYVTVVEALKGTVGDFEDFVVIFFADTVFPGERHIVAVQPIREGTYWHDFTSPHSLFSMDQLDEILAILG